MSVTTDRGEELIRRKAFDSIRFKRAVCVWSPKYDMYTLCEGFTLYLQLDVCTVEAQFIKLI